jgi:hypothetical protein
VLESEEEVDATLKSGKRRAIQNRGFNFRRPFARSTGAGAGAALRITKKHFEDEAIIDIPTTRAVGH